MTLLYPLLSIYERASLLGTRMTQLSNNAKSTLSSEDLSKCKSIREIAEMELKQRKLPLHFVRENTIITLNDVIV